MFVKCTFNSFSTQMILTCACTVCTEINWVHKGPMSNLDIFHSQIVLLVFLFCEGRGKQKKGCT